MSVRSFGASTGNPSLKVQVDSTWLSYPLNLYILPSSRSSPGANTVDSCTAESCESGPTLPLGMCHAAMVASDEDLFLMGGWTKDDGDRWVNEFYALRGGAGDGKGSWEVRGSGAATRTAPPGAEM